MILRYQHLALSRALGGVVFCLSLVLTPRAWVEEPDSVAEVPVESLSSMPSCDEQARPKVWLNPDEVPTTECETPPAEGESPAS